MIIGTFRISLSVLALRSGCGYDSPAYRFLESQVDTSTKFHRSIETGTSSVLKLTELLRARGEGQKVEIQEAKHN